MMMIVMRFILKASVMTNMMTESVS